MKTLIVLIISASLASCESGECSAGQNSRCDGNVMGAPTIVIDGISEPAAPGMFWIKCAGPEQSTGACFAEGSPTGFLLLSVGSKNPKYGKTYPGCLHELNVILTIPKDVALTAGMVLSGVSATATFQQVDAGVHECVWLQPKGDYSTSSAIITVLPRTGESWAFAVEADFLQIGVSDAEAGSLPARVQLNVPSASCTVTSFPSC